MNIIQSMQDRIDHERRSIAINDAEIALHQLKLDMLATMPKTDHVEADIEWYRHQIRDLCQENGERRAHIREIQL